MSERAKAPDKQETKPQTDQKRRKRNTRILTGVLLALLVLAGLFWALAGRILRPVLSYQTEEIPSRESVLAGEALPEAVTEENRDKLLYTDRCEILADGKTVQVDGYAAALPESDDDRLYLLELKAYETTLPNGREALASTEKTQTFSFQTPLEENSEDSLLYSKFTVAVKIGGSYVALTTPRFIENPEILADFDRENKKTASIKGLLVDPQKLETAELDDLKIKHAIYNIPVARLLGETTHAGYPTVEYTYNGKTYQFNGQVVAEYDHVFRTLTKKGIVVTAILLNSWTEEYQNLIHPLSRQKDGGHYYAFNAAEEEGTAYLAAIGSFLAERYRDETHGIVMNWVVGNEVNVRSDWNYMQYIDLESYVREYANAVRIFYNAIKAQNANANVYISLDQQWNRRLASESSYDARALLDCFNALIRREGNIDWGLAHHPYAYPLTAAKFWDVGWKYRKLITDSADSPMVTIQNIHVVTDYMQREEMLTADGEVRSIILSELGFTSSDGEKLQAAAFAYAYQIASNNQHIDALHLSRETDAPEECEDGLELGLCTEGGRRKFIYNIFREIDGPNGEEVIDFAREQIGISSWDEIIRQH